MPRNGSGTYVLPPSNPVAPGTDIESSWANETMADLGQALSQSISTDGQTLPVGNLPMAGFHHTNVSDPTSRNQYASLGMVQDGMHQRVNISSGFDNLVGSLVGGATNYVAGAMVSFFALGSNSGPMTLNYNGIGSRALLNRAGGNILAGQVVAGQYLLATYTGTAFQLLNVLQDITTLASPIALRVSGQQRPGDGVFPQITQNTPTSILVPGGTAWLVPPNTDPNNTDTQKVTWLTQVVNLQYLTSSASTTIGVDNLGNIVQYPGRAIGGALREAAILGVVQHLTGTIGTIVTKPMIYADDNYRAVDTTSLLTNALISGGKISPNGTNTLHMDIANGTIFMPGAASNVQDSPNTLDFPGAVAFSFRTFAGQSTIGGSLLQTAPVTQYDPAGSGVITTLPNNADTVIHRIYYLYGAYIWVFGQYIYTSVENACSLIEVDRSKFVPPSFLSDATLLAEVVATKNATNLGNIAQAAIISVGQINFSIGSPGGITEAPVDGLTYGRKNAAWAVALAGVSPLIQTDATVYGPGPKWITNLTPVGAGVSGLAVRSGGFNWFGLEVTNPDDKAYLRSYNPANGILRWTTTFDLANGQWTFPAQVVGLGDAWFGPSGVGGAQTTLNVNGQDAGVSRVTLMHNSVPSWSMRSNTAAVNGQWTVVDNVANLVALNLTRLAGNQYSLSMPGSMSIGSAGVGTTSYAFNLDCNDAGTTSINFKENSVNGWILRSYGPAVNESFQLIDVPNNLPLIVVNRGATVSDISMPMTMQVGKGGAGTDIGRISLRAGAGTTKGIFRYTHNGVSAWELNSDGPLDLGTWSVYDPVLGLSPIIAQRIGAGYRTSFANSIWTGLGGIGIVIGEFFGVATIKASPLDQVGQTPLSITASTLTLDADGEIRIGQVGNNGTSVQVTPSQTQILYQTESGWSALQVGTTSMITKYANASQSICSVTGDVYYEIREQFFGIAKLKVDTNLGFPNLPTSAAGLSPGHIWRDAAAGNVLKIVP